MTSASARQVKSILWKEVRKQHSRAKFPIGGVCALDPETGLQLPDGREILGFSTNEPEKMAGVSGKNLLFIIDEASGVPEEIFEAIEGNRAGGAKVALFSNPTRTVGTFYDAFHSKSEFWHRLHISSEDSPNVTEGRSVVPGLATLDWVNEKRDEWGEESPLYNVRVRGNFPRQGQNVVISLDLIEAALEREPENDDGQLRVGVDVARFGDDESVIQVVRGKVARMPVARGGLDGPQLAGLVREVVRAERRGDEPVTVNIDGIGVGASAYDALKDDADLTVNSINVSESATDELYALLRDQLWHAARDWLKDGGVLPDDGKLHGELVAPSYSFDARGRIKVEGKDSIKKKLRRSPDRADALSLAVYTAPEAPAYEPARSAGRWSRS
jgi:phage terminase large subunit